jgi:hypothetical protein
MITKEDKELMAEIVADSIALQLLKDKCVWEAMSRYASGAIRGTGPRTKQTRRQRPRRERRSEAVVAAPDEN